MPEAQNNLGNAYLAQGRLAEARLCYNEALRRKANMAQPNASLGMILQKEGKWDEAIIWLRRATELAPNSLGFLGLLAESLVEREQFGEAVACYEKMLKLKSDEAVPHNVLGWLLQEEGRLDLAAEHLVKAISLKPDLAIAHINMGGVFEKLGEFAMAEASFRRALADEESRGYALARLALLLRGDLPDSDREEIERRLADRESADPARVNLMFALAAVHDAQERYAAAAACARQANALALAHLESRKLAYDPAEHDRLVSGVIDAFTPDLFARLATAGHDSRRPVFIVGLPRSGTSMIEQILASHSEFHGCGELPFVRHNFESIPELLGARSRRHRASPT